MSNQTLTEQAWRYKRAELGVAEQRLIDAALAVAGIYRNGRGETLQETQAYFQQLGEALRALAHAAGEYEAARDEYAEALHALATAHEAEAEQLEEAEQ